ncbi:MAG: hypothetical protein ACQEV7_22670 [Bacillota bacterium]
MKKLILSFSVVFLMIFSTGNVQATDGETLTEWITEKIHSLSTNKSNISFIKETYETEYTNHSDELELFLMSTTTSSKKEIELHKREYLTLLHETKEILKTDPLAGYVKKREESIHTELEKELEEFLASLTGE